MRKYKITIEEVDGPGEPVETTVSDLLGYRGLPAFLAKHMPDQAKADERAIEAVEAKAFDASIEEHRVVRAMLSSELSPLRTFNAGNFGLLCDSPDVCPGERVPIVMLHFVDPSGKSWVLPLGDREEAIRVGAGIVEVSRRLGTTVPAFEGTRDVFLFHGEQRTAPVVDRIESSIRIIDKSGDDFVFRFNELSLLDFRDLVQDLIASAAKIRQSKLM